MVSGCCESQLPKNSLKHTSQKAARKSRKETGLVQQRRRRRRTAERISVIIKMTFSVMGRRGSARVETEKAKEAGEAKQFKNVHRHCRENFNTRRVAVWSRQQGAEEFWQQHSRVQICLTSTLHSLRKSICQ